MAPPTASWAAFSIVSSASCHGFGAAYGLTMNLLRRPLSYANVTATLARVFAMSGGAMAASRYMVNSTKQINPKVLKALKGKTGAAGSIGAPGKEGPPGKEGAQGVAGTNGTNGTNGATNVVVRYVEATTTTGSDGNAQANCNPGERATGGGVELDSGSSIKMWYFQPGGRPVPNTQGATPTGWYGSWWNETGSTDMVRVYAICASP